MDTQLLKTQIEGLEAKGRDLRSKERLFLKAQGLDEQAEKAKAKIPDIEAEIETINGQLADCKQKKADAVSGSLKAIQSTMTELLPEGQGIVHIEEDGSLLIGWLKEGAGTLTPYSGLSGGEKVVFDQALANSLIADGDPVLIYEAAELDAENLTRQLELIREKAGDVQVVVNSCHAPDKAPEGWMVVEL